MKNRTISIALLLLALTGKATAQTKDSLNNAVSLQYNYQHFNKQFSTDWQMGSVEYKRQTTSGAFLGRFNYANRLQKSGWQAETEAYPVLSKKVYAYVGAGFSPSMPVFPKWRSGASVFINLPKAWETESGIRHLYFDKHIWIGTAGLSKYIGNWLFNFRSFISINTPAENQSFFFTTRRYLRNEKDFVWLQAGSGISPDESRNVLINNNALLRSRRVSAGTNFSINSRFGVTLSAGWSKDQILESTYGYQAFGNVGITQRF